MSAPQPIKRLSASNQNTAATRTTVSTTVLTAILMIANKGLNWNITLEDLTPWLPAIAVVYGFSLRAMYAIGERFPALERVFFGLKGEPQYESTPLPPPPPQS